MSTGSNEVRETGQTVVSAIGLLKLVLKSWQMWAKFQSYQWAPSNSVNLRVVQRYLHLFPSGKQWSVAFPPTPPISFWAAPGPLVMPSKLLKAHALPSYSKAKKRQPQITSFKHAQKKYKWACRDKWFKNRRQNNAQNWDYHHIERSPTIHTLNSSSTRTHPLHCGWP